MTEALYRKYRPQIFEDVIGQEHIERTIKNALEQDKVSHAYLFCGPRGTGKTTTARLLAKALLCESGPTPDPDGTCADCVMIANGEHPDVYELDAASRTGVENVREEIIGRVQFAPTRGRYKVYIIDEVHMLSTAAFNALLKTLEEPPSHVVFILATTDPQKVPETIHSRCQRFDFRRISAEAIVSRLGAICMSEDVEFEGEALDLIAHRAEGGMRNALTSLEQLIAFGEGKVTLDVAERLLGGIDSNDLAEIIRAIGSRDVAACFCWTAEYVETGADLAQFVRDLADHVRNLYVMTLTDADVALEVGDAERRELVSELPLFEPDRLARLLGVLGDLSAELKTSTNPRLSFEIALTRMVRPDSDLTLEALAERVEALESGYSAVTHVSNVVVAPAAGSVQRVDAAPTTDAACMEAPSVYQDNTDPAFESIPVSASVAIPVPAPTPTAASVAIPALAADSAATPPFAATTGVVTMRLTPTSDAASDYTTGALSPQLAVSLQNPVALQRMWQAALVSLKKNKAAYNVLFLNTKAVYDNTRGLLLIEFPADNSFTYKAVQKPDVQEAVAQALVQACGERLSFAFYQAGAPASPTTSVHAPAPMPAPAPTSAPIPTPTSTSRPVSPGPGSISLDAYDSPPCDDTAVPNDSNASPCALPTQEASSQADSPSHPLTPEAPDFPPDVSLQPQPIQPTGTSTPTAVVPPAEPETIVSPVDASASQPDDLQAILAAGFGDGVVVREVEE